MADKVLEIKDLEVLYKSGKNPVHAVNGISLTLNKGETLGLVGETGAGKTTTALAILRLLPERTGCINQGQILFEGCDLLTLTQYLRPSPLHHPIDRWVYDLPEPRCHGGRSNRGGHHIPQQRAESVAGAD